MRPSMRLLNLEVPSSRSVYVCSTCRSEVRPRPVVARQFLRNASNATPITERVRRKLWGTDNPPGMKDPYGGKGVLEQRFQKNQPESQEPEQAEVESAEATEAATGDLAPGDAYVPADTWDGIARIGHLGRWSDFSATRADSYSPFKLKTKVTKKGQLDIAAHQAAVEISLLHTLKKPLTNASNVSEHDKAVFKLIWKCQIKPNGQWDSAVTFPNKEAEKALVYIFEQIGGQPGVAVAEAAAEEAGADVEEWTSEEKVTPFFGYNESRDKGFLTLELNDPAIKFAFLKRFSQLSGHHLPDPVIHSISTVGQAVRSIQKSVAPKPQKLAEILSNRQGLQNLPNVKVFAKQQKSIHRDEEYGRKKIIEAELRSRGLIE